MRGCETQRQLSFQNVHVQIFSQSKPILQLHPDSSKSWWHYPVDDDAFKFKAIFQKLKIYINWKIHEKDSFRFFPLWKLIYRNCIPIWWHVSLFNFCFYFTVDWARGFFDPATSFPARLRRLDTEKEVVFEAEFRGRNGHQPRSFLRPKSVAKMGDNRHQFEAEIRGRNGRQSPPS